MPFKKRSKKIKFAKPSVRYNFKRASHGLRNSFYMEDGKCGRGWKILHPVPYIITFFAFSTTSMPQDQISQVTEYTFDSVSVGKEYQRKTDTESKLLIDQAYQKMRQEADEILIVTKYNLHDHGSIYKNYRDKFENAYELLLKDPAVPEYKLKNILESDAGKFYTLLKSKESSRYQNLEPAKRDECLKPHITQDIKICIRKDYDKDKERNNILLISIIFGFLLHVAFCIDKRKFLRDPPFNISRSEKPDPKKYIKYGN